MKLSFTKFLALLVLALSIPWQAAYTTRSVSIIAHRGASYDAPENTIASTMLAWTQNADAVETDVRLTKDGKVVISHDDNVKRLAGVDASIAEMTLAETQALDVGHFKGKQFDGEKMPTIDELIATVPTGRQLFIHIKTGNEIFPALDATLRQAAAASKNIVLICFDLQVLAEAHQKWPQFTTLWLVGYDASALSVEELIEKSKEAGIGGLDMSGNWPLDQVAVQRIKAAHLQLQVWTVDDPQVAQRWLDIGVDGITTNRAGWLREKIEI
ncbi:MAG TPA: glycerophosphodiester phosphodiesterase [Steroidobacteraceae bacterium]|nr:glycerophosphodiester phosphodiesterase [Steroidobacteraceae bacterium]